MQSFLERLAQYHISHHLTEINDFCFVFPSRRACIFFERQLAGLVKQPIWSPKIITISEFFREVDPTPVADNITLLFRLHLSYCRVMQSDISIDEFLPLGEMRSEEHTSELQSRPHLVCRLLLEKKKKT